MKNSILSLLKSLTIPLFSSIILLTLTTSAQAQLTQFVNPTVAPLHFNPAFAGSLAQPRLAFGFAPFRVRAGYASYDQVSNRLHGALGGEFYMENYLDYYFDLRFSAIYAAKFNLGANWTLSPALKVGYQERIITIDGCDSDYCDPILIDFNRKTLNFSPGILINSPDFYFGVHSELLGSIRLKETSLYDPVYHGRSARIWKFQSGYHFQPDGRSWSLAATGVLMLTNHSIDYIGQLIYTRKWLLAGIGYSNANINSISFSAGYKHRLFRLMGVYNYHPRRTSPIAGSAEVSLIFYLPGKKGGNSPESSSLL